jgi:hypothetical protein
MVTRIGARNYPGALLGESTLMNGRPRTMNTRLRDQAETRWGDYDDWPIARCLLLASEQSLLVSMTIARYGPRSTQAGEQSTHVVPQGLSAGAFALAFVFIGAELTKVADDLLCWF